MGDTQILFEPETFAPRRFVRGGHLQTLAGFFFLRSVKLPAPDERFVEVAAGVKILCHCHWQQDRRGANTLIIVHGLEGCSESHYMRGIAAKAYHAGFNVIRMNQRTCGGTEHLTPTLYNSGLSQDYRAIVHELVRV